MTSLSELARAGSVQIIPTPLRMETGSGELRVLTAQDVALGRAATGRGSAGPGLVTARPGTSSSPCRPGRRPRG
nr:hypothetical protein GCM10020093_024740 [Planobispora longispora]